MKPYELAEWNDMEPIPNDFTLISVCCGTRPWGEVHNVKGFPPTGICSKCKDHTSFEQEIDNE